VKQLAALDEQGVAVTAEDGEDRAGDGRGLPRPEGPRRAGQLALEEGRGVLHGLRDPVERARKAVTRRIRNAMRRITRAHPRLGQHLATSIRTGEFCSYQPERAILWSVHANTG
jgi:hypothetical protein